MCFLNHLPPTKHAFHSLKILGTILDECPDSITSICSLVFALELNTFVIELQNCCAIKVVKTFGKWTLTTGCAQNGMAIEIVLGVDCPLKRKL